MISLNFGIKIVRDCCVASRFFNSYNDNTNCVNASIETFLISSLGKLINL